MRIIYIDIITDYNEVAELNLEYQLYTFIYA